MDEQNNIRISGVPQITMEGKNIHDISSFYKEVNRVFMQDEDWELGESLDAFNDLLFGGIGIAKGLTSIRLVWNNSDICRHTLGYEITKAHYLKKLEPDSPFNRTYVEQKLTDLEAGNGQTYYEIILEIIAEHPNIQLSLS